MHFIFAFYLLAQTFTLSTNPIKNKFTPQLRISTVIIVKQDLSTSLSNNPMNIFSTTFDQPLSNNSTPTITLSILSLHVSK